MADIITRQTGPYAKGSPLTNEEVDNNFINLKAEAEDKKIVNAGMLEEPLITNHGDGSITVAEAECNLYSDDLFTIPAGTFTIPEATFILTDNDVNYVIVDYNSGTPEYQVTLDLASITVSDDTPVNTIHRQGTILHFLSWDSPGKGLAEKLWFKDIKLVRFAHESGHALSETATPVERTILISAGLLWNGIKRQNNATFNSSINPFKQRIHVSGIWSESFVTQYNNTYYDDGTDIIEATSNRWIVNWIYRDAGEDDLHADIIFGNAQYNTAAAAELATVPTGLQEIMTTHHILVGRIIIQKGASSGIVESVFTTVFAAGVVTDHNELVGLQGGTAGEYYHMTAAELAALGPEFVDDTFRVQNVGDNTKELVLDISGITTATTRTLAVPDKDGIIALVGDALVVSDLGTLGATLVMNMASKGKTEFEAETSATALTISITNPPASGLEGEATIMLDTTTLPASITFPSGSVDAPTITEGFVWELSFKTIDGGTTWRVIGKEWSS